MCKDKNNRGQNKISSLIFFAEYMYLGFFRHKDLEKAWNVRHKTSILVTLVYGIPRKAGLFSQSGLSSLEENYNPNSAVIPHFIIFPVFEIAKDLYQSPCSRTKCLPIAIWAPAPRYTPKNAVLSHSVSTIFLDM